MEKVINGKSMDIAHGKRCNTETFWATTLAFKQEAIATQKVHLAIEQNRLTLTELEEVLKTFHNLKGDIRQDCIISTSVGALIQFPTKNRLHTIVHLLREFFMESYERVNDARHFPIETFLSAFFPPIDAPELDNLV